MVSRRITLSLISMVAGLAPFVVQAGGTWENAQTLSIGPTPTVVYGQLTEEGQAIFYRLTTKQPTVLRLELGQSEAFKNFSPRVVLYQPDGQTIGPLLPMDQPPHSLALVYPSKVTGEVFDVFTQVTYDQSLVLPLSLPAAGTYYLAVYNASAHAGRYRLTLDNGQASIVQWSDAWRLPQRWWQDQIFAGLTWQTLLTPTLLIVLAILVVEQLRFYHLHHLAPSQRPGKSKRKKKA